MEEMTFGAFVRQKRLAANINLRQLANDLGIAPAFLSDIENDHRYPPEKEILVKMAELLKLSSEDTDLFFDLAGRTKKYSVSPDLSDYIMGSDMTRVALRIARDTGAGEKEWEKIIRILEGKDES